ncbi:MAG: hypothetical protein IJB89_00700 [Akkermansia sp.]|nr:hypothetical protein [Akkermansia sp.]
MNSAQRQRILDAIVEYQKADFDAPFQKKYKETDTNTVESVSVGDYTLAELLSEADLAVNLLYELLEKGNWKVVPCDNIPLPTYGNITLINIVTNIRAYFLNASYEAAVQSVKSLVYFEMHCGIWHIDKRPKATINKSIIALEKQLTLSLNHAKAREDKVDEMIEVLDNKKTEIEKLISTKRQELETLRINQSESTTILNNIRNIESNTARLEKSITESDNKTKKIIDSLESSQSIVNNQISTNNNNIAAGKKSVADFTEEAKSKITQISSDFEQVSSHADEVRKMMHFINDGTLTHSFNKRKRTIWWSVLVWGILCFLGIIVLGGWIWYVFTHLQTNLAEGTQLSDTGIIIFANLIVNVAKTSPAVVLLWFILAQYKKERHLLEEYAFREAVAATLTSYLDQLDGEKDSNKCTLLMDTVEKLYTQPIMMTNGKDSTDFFKSEEFKMFSKACIDIAKAYSNPQNNKL